MKLSRIWHLAADKTERPKDLSEEFNAWQNDTLERLKKHAPDLYSGKTGPLGWERNEVHEIVRKVGAKGSSTYRKRLLFLAKGIVAGNAEHKWNIPVNPILIKINREKNHITPERFTTRQCWQPLLKAFLEDLENSFPEDSAEQIGQILLCTIFFGGLIDTKWLSPFCTSLLDRQVFQSNTWLWAEMERTKNIDKKDTEQKQTRRWVADPFSQLLIYRFLQQGDDSDLQQPVWQLLNCYLSRLKPKCDRLPLTLSELLNWAFDRYTSLLPGTLIGYAQGDILATSMQPPSWLRIMDGKMIPVSRAEPSASIAIKKRRYLRITTGDHVVKDDQIKYFREFTGQINPNRIDKALAPHHGRKIIKDFLEEHHGKLSICLQLLLRWAKQLLSPRISSFEGRQKKAPLEVSSVYRYLNEIGIPLLMVCELNDPRQMNPLDLEMLYEETNLRKNSKKFNARRLEYFHGYLHYFHEVKMLDFAELFSDLESQSINVDANIITPAIYSALLDSLGWKNNPDRWQEVWIIATIFGYRLGFRPSEIQSLLLKDIHWLPEAELLIRNSLFHRTKTFAGKRRGPLLLLSDEEIAFIESFLEKRWAEYKKWGNELFLHHPVRKTGMLSDEELFKQIRENLRTLTGDQSLRFYSLRHTCFSHLMSLLLLRDDINLELPDVFNHSDFSKERRERIKRELFSNERCGRKFPQGLALLAGHNSPRTSYKHYIHLADWLLGYHLWHASNCPAISAKALTEISNLSQSTIYYHRDKTDDSQHRLIAITKAKAREFIKDLRHPLTSISQPLRGKLPPKQADNSTGLPTWEKALDNFRTCLDPTSAGYRFAKKLPDNTNWPLAAQVYTALSGLRWQQFKTILPIIRYALIDNYPGRWNSITFKQTSNVNQILSLLKLCRIRHDQILVIHHPRYKQNDRLRRKYSGYWKNKFKTDWILSGEECDQEEKPRGIASFVITTKPITAKRLQSPRRARMSTGFIFALDLALRETEKRTAPRQ